MKLIIMKKHSFTNWKLREKSKQERKRKNGWNKNKEKTRKDLPREEVDWDKEVMERNIYPQEMMVIQMNTLIAAVEVTTAQKASPKYVAT